MLHPFKPIIDVQPISRQFKPNSGAYGLYNVLEFLASRGASRSLLTQRKWSAFACTSR